MSSLFVLALFLGQAPAAPMTPSPAAGHQALISVIDRADVPAREMGVLKKIYVREGEVVKAGQILAELESTEAEIGLRKAKDELAIADAQARHELKLKVAQLSHAVAEAELTRAVESNKKFADAVSATELDQLRLSRDKAEAEIDHARYELSLALLTVRLKGTELAGAEQALERRRVASPIDGKVVAVSKRLGEWTQPGEQLFRVVNLDRVRAECLLSAKDYPDDLAGAPITATLPTRTGSGTRFEGRVTFVDPEINAVNGQFRIWAEIENRDHALRPGHRVTLVLPAAASSTADASAKEK